MNFDPPVQPWLCLLSLILILANTTLARAQMVPQNPKPSACAEHIGSCSYYSCRARQLRCDRNSYVLKFGLNYCKKFDERIDHYSRRGQEFLNKVKTCLQTQLEHVGPNLTCESAASSAPDHHLACYIQSGYCELGWGDREEIAQTVWRKFVDDGHFRTTAFQILNACQRKN